MTTLVVSLITAIVSAALASAGTYVAARRDLQLKFDESLRDLRIDAYKELWNDLGKLAKYGRPEPLSNAAAQGLRNTLRGWYFETGGLVLSNQARSDYFTLLDALELVIAAGDNVVSPEDDEYLRVLGSRLRTAMTRDVGTRRTFVFRGDPEREEPRLEPGTYIEEGGARTLTIVTRRRLRFARRLKPSVRRLVAYDPRVTVSDGTHMLAWDPARRTFAARTPSEAAAQGRLFLLEEGYIVEGPSGWRRGDEGPRAPTVIWKRRNSLGAKG